MYIYIYYTYISCLQRYRGTFKDESLMTIRDLREQHAPVLQEIYSTVLRWIEYVLYRMCSL